MRLLFTIFFTLAFLFAQDGLLESEERSVFDNTPTLSPTQININGQTVDIQDIAPLDEEQISQSETESINSEIDNAQNIPEIQLSQEELDAIAQKEFQQRYFEPLLFEELSNNQSHNIYAKFINYPTILYTNQRFSLEIEALITTKDFTRIETRFIGGSGISVINPQSEWRLEKNSIYKNLYYLKAYTQKVVIPTFQIVLYNNDEVVDTVFLEPEEINYTNIALADEQFSNIIAKDLKVLSSKTRQYSNSELLTVIELESLDGNLEDFRLKEYAEQLLMSLEEEYPKQKLTYNAIVPIYTKEMKFNYYNTATNEFKQITVPIKLEEELISTQTDLNPNNSNFEIYKKIALGVVAIVFILLYILKRRNIYIVVAIIVSIIFFIYVKPNSAMIIEESTKIYILPTNNSTVFYVTPNKQLVEVLEKKDEFTKILFNFSESQNRSVGWIKEKDIVED